MDRGRGSSLIHRDRKGMLLQSVDNGRPVVRVRILEVFPLPPMESEWE